jgi:regulatory protein
MDKKIVVKMAKFCAYQERCLQEINEKLKQFLVSYEEKKEIIDYLTQEKYLNETRYAQAFVRGKFLLKHWGKVKIIYHLQKKGINQKDINEGLKEIEEEDYIETLTKLLQKKYDSLQEKKEDKQVIKQKLYNYAQQKGYEFDYIKQAITNIKD